MVVYVRARNYAGRDLIAQRWLCGGQFAALNFLSAGVFFLRFRFNIVSRQRTLTTKLSVCDPEHWLCVPGTKIPAAIRSTIPSADIAFHPHLTSHACT